MDNPETQPEQVGQTNPEGTPVEPAASEAAPAEETPATPSPSPTAGEGVSSSEYVGPLLIAEKVVLEAKTKNGGDLIQVNFTNGHSEVIAKVMLEMIVTPQPTDLTSLRNARIYPLVAQILALLESYSVKVDEVDFLCTMVVSSLNFTLQQADDKLWGKERQDRTLVDIDQVTSKITVGDMIAKGYQQPS